MKDIEKITNENSIVVINYSVIPTIGTMLKTQYDEYNYFFLYSEQCLSSKAKNAGYEIVCIDDDPDQEMYVYGQDSSTFLLWVKCFYENIAVKTIGMKTKFPFRARNRRRFNMILRRKNLG